MTNHSSDSVSWLLWQASIMLLAAIGGIVVLRGLWLEYRGGKEMYFHKSKRLTERGEIWVMLGVFIEIVVGVGFAAKDGFEARQINMKISAEDPRNQPLVTLSAELDFLYKRNAKRPPVNSNDKSGGTFPPQIYLITQPAIYRLVLTEDMTEEIQYGQSSSADTNSGESMKFLWTPFEHNLFSQSLRTNPAIGQIADSIVGFSTSPYMVDDNFDIKWGRLRLQLNSTNIEIPILPKSVEHGELSGTVLNRSGK